MKDTRFEIRVAGFGGQGVVTIGRVLGVAFTIHEGINSVNTRSYGPESRGGACRSEVVASQGEIHYPSVRKADVLVALSQPALDKYKADMKEGGVLLVDPNSVKDIPKHVACHAVPAMEIALAVGSLKYQNSVVLGALAALLKSMLKKESLKSAVTENVPPKTIEKNLEAFEKGWEYLVAEMSNENPAG
ncbi:MAG: 2-oxoacid:acceptor oxidoreductase family protein [Chloroflexi bacterium]|nr:2-oxoacid:acceptor oxidoreductase family protein [Chloroflexota bacterium]